MDLNDLCRHAILAGKHRKGTQRCSSRQTRTTRRSHSKRLLSAISALAMGLSSLFPSWIYDGSSPHCLISPTMDAPPASIQPAIDALSRQFLQQDIPRVSSRSRQVHPSDAHAHHIDLPHCQGSLVEWDASLGSWSDPWLRSLGRRV